MFATRSTLSALGLQKVLGTSRRVRVGARSDASGLLAELSGDLPDVLVLDGQSDDPCITICEAAHNAHPELPILILTPTVDDAFARAALEAGAKGCMCADASAEDLVAAVRWVADGQAVLDPRITAQLLRWALETGDVKGSEPLSSREREVLLLVSQGESNKLIARQLGVTEHTVKTYLKRASSKLGCHTRASAAARAMKEGWI